MFDRPRVDGAEDETVHRGERKRGEIERRTTFVKMAGKRFITIVLSRMLYNGVRSKRRWQGNI